MKLPPKVQAELERIPGRWELELGKKHLHIRIDGKLAAVLPRDGYGNDRGPAGQLNIRACIRRAIRGAAA